MRTLGDRLDKERRRQGFRSLRAFQQALPDDVTGTSYASVYSYIKKGVEPSDEFIEAAARLLRVTPEYLKTGEGHPTGFESDDDPVGADGLSEEDSHELRQELAGLLSGWTADFLFRAEVDYRTVHIAVERFVLDVSWELGPRGFGVECEDTWDPLALTEPDPGIQREDLERFLEKWFGNLLRPKSDSYGGILAMWLSTLAGAYFVLLGERDRDSIAGG